MKPDEQSWLWLDLEMTGLDPDQDVIIEAAAVVTDKQLNEIAEWQAVISQPESVLERMKQAEWREYDETQGVEVKMGSVWDMHEKSGVLKNMAEAGKPETEVIKELAQFISEHFQAQAVLAGNSIHQDRRFVRKYWTEVEALLHYRMLDVTSLKLALATKDIRYEKLPAHNALEDIRSSIEELKFYLEHVS